MENEDDILSALQKGVTAAVAQSDNPSLPVKYLLKSFSIPNNQEWLEIVWIPNNRRGDFLGQEKNHRGILRLVLHWPNAGGDAYAPLRLLGSITRYFTKGLLLADSVQVYDTADAGGLVQDGDDVLIPCSIYYQSFTR